MGSEEEPEPVSTPKLPLLSIPPKKSPEDFSDMLTPPLHTSASVPFRWEEQPGKPRPCTSITTATTNGGPNKCLELPPRLQYSVESKMTKIPSPPTVLDGPYVGIMPAFQSSSFRIIKRERRQGSFGNSSVGSPEIGQLGDMVLRPESKKQRGGWFGSSLGRGRRGGKKGGVGGGRIVFSSSMDNISADFFGADDGSGGSARVRMARLKKNGSSSSLSEASRSHFWATMYEGFKQALPWRSKKPKKEGLTI